jgi:uncharacterized protein (DUF1697 family)
VALVVLLRGINVGGHRSFRPAMLAAALKHLDAVNIGAAGTFVIRKPAAVAQVRSEFARRLPFEAEIVICQGRDLARFIAQDPFAGQMLETDIVRFVSVLSRNPRATPRMPMTLPSDGAWLVRILGREGRFVYGLYRRHMKVIGYLGTLDKLFGVPATTRNWNTLAAIERALKA